MQEKVSTEKIMSKHPILRKYFGFLHWMNFSVEIVGGILLVFMTISVFASVASRFIANLSLAWVEEGAVFIMVWVVVMGTTLAIKAKHMIAVEAFASLFSGTSWKLIKTLVGLTAMIFIVILILAGWGMAKIAAIQYSPSLPWLSMFWVYLAIPVGGCFMFLNLLGNVIELWVLDGKQESEVLE